MNMCTTFHGNLYNNCWDISLKIPNGNLMVAMSDVIKIHCLETMNVSTNSGPNPFFFLDVKMFHRISQNFDLLMGWKEKSGDYQKPFGLVLWAPWISVPNFLQYFSLEWWTNHQTNTAIHIAMQLAWISINPVTQKHTFFFFLYDFFHQYYNVPLFIYQVFHLMGLQ